MPLDFLRTNYPNHRVEFSSDGMSARIFHPESGEYIKVEYIAEDDYVTYLILLSSSAFQHWHTSKPKGVIELVEELMAGKRISIDFFSDGENRIGGEMSGETVASLTYEALETYFDELGLPGELLGEMDHLQIRGWDPFRCFDAAIRQVGDRREVVRIGKEG